MKRILVFAFVSGFFVVLISCNGNKTRGKSSDNYDSLFLGIYLGMGKTAFYDHCWKLNKEKVFTHGPKNQEVEYRLETELDHPVMMRFYPDFYKEKIMEMPVTFTYQAWAPWNKELGSDSLLVKILPLFKKWYGEDFKVTQHQTQGTVYYKFDGKRRINIFKRDDQFVQAVFSDMELLKEMKAEQKVEPAN